MGVCGGGSWGFVVVNEVVKGGVGGAGGIWCRVGIRGGVGDLGGGLWWKSWRFSVEAVERFGGGVGEAGIYASSWGCVVWGRWGYGLERGVAGGGGGLCWSGWRCPSPFICMAHCAAQVWVFFFSLWLGPFSAICLHRRGWPWRSVNGPRSPPHKGPFVARPHRIHHVMPVRHM